MAMNPSLRAALSPFLGIGRGPAPVTETTALTPPAAPAAVDPAAAAPKGDEGDDDSGMKGKPATRKAPENDDGNGDEDGDDGDGDGDGDDDGDDDEGDEGDDDSDRDEMSGKKGKGKQAARNRERARIAAILGHPMAAANTEFAAHVALNTTLTRTEACAMIAAAPAAAPSLARRMEGAGMSAVRPGPTAPPVPPRVAIASSWDAAAKRVNL
jgi:hypothetical protein